MQNFASKLIRIFCILLVLLPGLHYASAATLSAPQQVEATSALEQYFDALQNGDVASLKSLMGGPLLEKRSQLLNNASYPSHLMNVYKNAKFQIVDTRTIDNDTVSIDAIINMGGQDILHRNFSLVRAGGGTATFRIFQEVEADSR